MLKLPNDFKAVYTAYLRGDISIDQLVSAGKLMGVTVAPYDPVDGRNAIYPVGNNSNRIGFTRTLVSPLGKKFQGVLKPAIIATINKMHKWICGDWDKDAFVYDDPRMQILDTNLHEYIDEYFDHEQRKIDFMHKIIDICLFIAKEDIYYSARMFDMANKLPFFILTPDEIENIQTFTKGVGSIDQFTMKPIVSMVQSQC